MKKALIALSVAAGMVAAAQAENTTTLYGSLGVETAVSKNGSFGNTLDENIWDLTTQTAKIGVKGTEDLANGLQAFFKFEFDFTGENDDANSGLNSTRYAYIGLTGDFGTVTFGKQDSLYKVVTNYNDIFQNNFWGENVNYGAATGGSRIPKVISYVSPNWSGFQFGVAGVLDGSATVVGSSDSKSFSGYQAGLWYNNYGFFAGVAYSSLDTGNTVVDLAGSMDVVGGSVGYSNDQFKVGLTAQHKSGNDLAGSANRLAYADGEKYSVAGEYYLGPNTFRAAFGMADLNKREADKNIYTYALGYQYNFSKRTYTYVEGEYIDWNKEFGQDDNGYTIRVGLRHDF